MVMKIVSCPPTVQVVVNRPDTKYQLGFSVQNGMVMGLLFVSCRRVICMVRLKLLSSY